MRKTSPRAEGGTMRRAFLTLLIILLCLVAISAIVATVSDKGIGRGRIAIVEVEGAIISPDKVIGELKKYGDDDGIDAVILRVNSPGGAVSPSQEIYEEVRRVSGKKTLVVSMGTLGASGGYYISAPAKLIIANPGTLTGSIGVIMEIPNMQGLMDKVGMNTEVIKSGRHKGMASPLRKMDPADRTILQGVIDDVYAQFVEDVAKSRGMEPQRVRDLADGRIYTGRQALENGLVDELGGLEYAITRTAELAGIEGEPVIVRKKKGSSFWDSIESMVNEDVRGLLPFTRVNYIMNP